MIFKKLDVEGAYLVDLEPKGDERGFFARAFCVEEFGDHGLDARIVQGNISTNERRGTLRGLHWQTAPAEEAKIVRCISGAVFDVVADVRPGSPTHGRWAGAELTADNYRMLYVPTGCAHGYLALEDGAAVYYLVTQMYSRAHERGLRWDDPAFGIEWPDLGVPPIVSPKDAAWPDYTPEPAAAPSS